MGPPLPRASASKEWAPGSEAARSGSGRGRGEREALGICWPGRGRNWGRGLDRGTAAPRHRPWHPAPPAPPAPPGALRP